MTDWIKYISVFFVIAPLLLSAITFKTFKFSPALLIFLSVGFTTDLLNLYSERLNIERQLVWDLYSIFECSMLLWMVRHRQNHLTFKAYFMTLLISVSMWTACQYLYGKSFLFALIAIAPLSIFIIIYQAFLVFYCAKEILCLCENENRIILSPLYWIHTGIFFYSIGTFFIMGFLSNPILHNMYYINNIVNIVTHLLFLIGLSMCLHASRSIRHILR
jgi:hypothetical protein